MVTADGRVVGVGGLAGPLLDVPPQEVAKWLLASWDFQRHSGYASIKVYPRGSYFWAYYNSMDDALLAKTALEATKRVYSRGGHQATYRLGVITPQPGNLPALRLQPQVEVEVEEIIMKTSVRGAFPGALHCCVSLQCRIHFRDVVA